MHKDMQTRYLRRVPVAVWFAIHAVSRTASAMLQNTMYVFDFVFFLLPCKRFSDSTTELNSKNNPTLCGVHLQC